MALLSEYIHSLTTVHHFHMVLSLSVFCLEAFSHLPQISPQSILAGHGLGGRGMME